MVSKPVESTSYVLRHDRKRQIMINTVGTIAAALSATSLLPQLYVVRADRDVSGLSILTPLIICVVSSLWLTYHLLTGTYHGAFSSTFNLMAALILTWTIYDISYLGGEGTDSN